MSVKFEVAAKVMRTNLSIKGNVVSVEMDLGCSYAAQVYFDDLRERAKTEHIADVYLTWKNNK